MLARPGVLAVQPGRLDAPALGDDVDGQVVVEAQVQQLQPPRRFGSTRRRHGAVVGRRLEAVAAAIGVDDLRYLSLDGLRSAAGGSQFCFGCMTGSYPV